MLNHHDSADPGAGKGKLHDSMFKKSMEDITVAASFLNIWLPDYIKAVCDLNTLAPEAGEFTGGHGTTRCCDKLYSLQTQDGSRGWIIIEHQATCDKKMLRRLDEYKQSVIKRECRQGGLRPLVVPVLVYHGARPWLASQEIYSLYRYGEIERKLNNGLPLVDLTATPYNELITHGKAAILELALKCGRVDKETEIVEFLQMATSLKARCPAELYALCMKYWINLNRVTVKNYLNCLDTLARQDREEIMLFSGGLVQEARMEGVLKGRIEGKQKVAQELINMGVSDHIVMKATGFTEDELASVKKDRQ